MTRLGLISLALAAVVTSTATLAQPAQSAKQAENALKFRQSIFQLVRSNMGPLGAMAKGQLAYDTAVMGKNAQRMAQLADMIPDYFMLNTTDYPLNTEAKDDIWANMSDFSDKAMNLKKAALALADTASKGDESAFRKAIGDVSATCKACHDKYKAD